MKLFNILSFLIPVFSFGQMMENEKGTIFSDHPFFNEKFIRSVKLKSLTGTISSKKELSTIKQTGKKQAYFFNENGSFAGSFQVSQKNDTSFIYYEYDNNKNMIVKRFSDSYGFYSYTYTYNGQNDMVKKVYAREKNANKSKINFKLGEQYVVFQEGYKVEVTDSTLTKLILNSNGRPYQRQQQFFNSLGYLLRVENKLLINNQVSKEVYEYNERGLLKSIQYYDHKDTIPTKGFLYNYDEWGNVSFIDEYRKNVRTKHKEILYDQSNFILKTILSQ
ncbi:MAG: hypothetical protein VXW67_01160, partial [Bacteroidota bacterium]|nr:hypothetical protein [Bacteroidota bacterium]